MATGTRAITVYDDWVGLSAPHRLGLLRPRRSGGSAWQGESQCPFLPEIKIRHLRVS